MTCPNCTCPACVARRSTPEQYLEDAKTILTMMIGAHWADKLALSIVPASCMPEREGTK